MNMIPAVATDGSVRINGGTQVPLERSISSNDEVTLGIRLEDLEPIDGSALISGTVNVQEPLGHETLIHVGTAFGDLIAKADGRTPPPVGATVNLSTAPENIHVFDAASGPRSGERFILQTSCSVGRTPILRSDLHRLTPSSHARNRGVYRRVWRTCWRRGLYHSRAFSTAWPHFGTGSYAARVTICRLDAPRT